MAVKTTTIMTTRRIYSPVCEEALYEKHNIKQMGYVVRKEPMWFGLFEKEVITGDIYRCVYCSKIARIAWRK